MSRFFKHYYCSNIVAFLPSLIMHQSFQSGKIGDRIFLTRPSSSRLLQGRIVERGTVGHPKVRIPFLADSCCSFSKHIIISPPLYVLLPRSTPPQNVLSHNDLLRFWAIFVHRDATNLAYALCPQIYNFSCTVVVPVVVVQ
jgi:hypothetical protein